MNRSEIEKRISELKATERALVGSDEGTHGKPSRIRVYEEISGERYAVYSFANGNGSRISEEEANEETEGRMRVFPNETAKIREKQTELKKLEKMLRNAK